MYNKIINPNTGHYVKTTSKLGQEDPLVNYIEQLTSGSSQPKKRDLTAARERQRLEKLKETASSRRKAPPIPLTLSPSPIIKEPHLSTPNSNTSDYDEPDT